MDLDEQIAQVVLGQLSDHQMEGGMEPTWPDCNADLDDRSLEDAAAVVLGVVMHWFRLTNPEGLRACLVRLSASGKGCHVSWPSGAYADGERLVERALMGDDPLRISLDLIRDWEKEILWDIKLDRPTGNWTPAWWWLDC